ncbi:MAG: Gfo/Idh/MocA family oxidoreductase [Bacteroidales bacterium]|jgi:predicted dehydrogenase|nr:Gfo/Idh/MocA family oxidoreductase [Bacteroidales bacterium]
MNRRRIFLKQAMLGSVAAGCAVGLSGIAQSCNGSGKGTPCERKRKGKSVMGLRCEPLSEVRIAVIGLGRGGAAVYRLARIEGVKIPVICDLRNDRIEKTQQYLKEAGHPEAIAFSGENDWQKICERDDIDLIYNATPWELHVPVAIHAMQHGKHAAIEVPAATTIDDCWTLVETAETTQRHCMMLENCCYDFFELTTLNMARNGLFGEIYHGEGGYLHSIPWLNWDKETKQPTWRLKYSQTYVGCQYPTHGLGPVSQLMNINKGDRFDFLSSMSTNQYGITLYAEETFGKNSPEAKDVYRLGDMNTTLIRTVNGHTIMVQHDITSPRPYDRLYKIIGTKGYATKYPEERLAFSPDHEKFLHLEEFKAVMEKYEHPLIKLVGEKAKQVGGHGGMDFIMDWRLIYCLRNGLPLDQNVYDAAAWSSIVGLSRKAIENKTLVDVPDFTYGDWNKKNLWPEVDMENIFF